MTTTRQFTIVNDRTYASPQREVHKLEVEFVLDLVPGPFAQPEDLMKWLIQNPYVKGVHYVTEDRPIPAFDPKAWLEGMKS
jgi:hypothetical protein